MAWLAPQSGLLQPAASYRAAALRGWACMARPAPVGAVHASGLLGFCQKGGASPNGNFNSSTSSDFCVGVFLLAGSQVAALMGS